MAYFSKKHVAVALLAVIVVIGLFLLFEYKNKPQEIDVAKLLVGNASANSGDLTLSNKDLDEDGLLDWEEALWKTEIDNRDTDGDGTFDGQEIKDGRDPAKAGPQDEIENYENFQTSSAESNQTETLAQQFLIAYAKLVQSGDLTEENKTRIIADLIKENISKEIVSKIYTEKDILINKDATNEALKRYGNELGGAILTNLPKNNQKEDYPIELVYLKSAVETKNPSDIAKIEVILSDYKKMISSILRIEVPKDATKNHISILNSLEKIASTINTFKSAITDPLKTLNGTSAYLNDMQNLQAAFSNINLFFATNNIQYKESEPGNFFSSFQ